MEIEHKVRTKPVLTKFCGVFLLLLLPFWVRAQSTAVLGKWETEEGESHIEIYQKGESFHGRIVWLQEPKENGKYKRDKNNPDENLRNRKIEGMELLRNFTYAGRKKWKNGEIYDPKSGKTYSCQMTLSEPDVLEVRGYIGVSWIGRTTTWRRVKE